MMWVLLALGFVVTVVPFNQMRYPTAADWTVTQRGTEGWLPVGNGIRVTVADTGSWRYNFLLALHESVEAWLCRRHGITQAQVDDFDMVQWPMAMNVWDARFTDTSALSAIMDVRRVYGDEVDMAFLTDEPGDYPLAPYHEFHVTASRWERRAARLLLVNWNAYEARLNEVMG